MSAESHRPGLNVLQTIGATPLVELRRVVPSGCARILVKVEGQNPTGSMKDRAALAMIEAAEESGSLTPGGSVVEYSGGSMGTALAFVCAAKGYPLRLFSSDAFSQEKRDHMAALGAQVELVPSDGGRITETLIREMIARARAAAQQPGVHWTDQLNNAAGALGYRALGRELVAQWGGVPEAFVTAVGTGHSLHGIATALRAQRADLHVVAVEPAESPVLSTGKTGAHRIEGIGIGFVPPLWQPHFAHEIVTVSTERAADMARRLAREEGLFAGTSAGANVVAAIEVGQRLGAGAAVATLLCDSGVKYLSTDLYRQRARHGARP